MPKPRRQFSRPSIELGGGPKREWQHLPIEEVLPGDTIADFGELESRDWHWNREDLIVTSTFGRTERLPKDTMVHAYVLPSKEPQ